MSSLTTLSTTIRPKATLPPSPPHPAIVQTFAGRRWPYAYIERCQAICGHRFTLTPVGMPPLVFLTTPQDIRATLTAPADKLHPGAGGATIAPIVGEQSFMLHEEAQHLHERGTVKPAFHKPLAATHANLLADATERDVTSWPLQIPIPLHPYIRALTLKVLLQIIFSDEHRVIDPLHQSMIGMLNVTDGLLLQAPKIRHIPGWRSAWRGFLAHRAAVDGMIHQLIDARRSDGPGSHDDLLDTLLTAENGDGSPTSERQIRDTLVSIILAGHETTAGQVAWAFQLLAHNPQAQQRLIEELDSTDGGEDYLTATIHETMRHKPVFLFAIPRKVVAPINIGEWTYAPPAHLAACTYLMHHNPDLYPQPHSFRPERFLGTSTRTQTWLPWGGGRRHCLGRHFAMLEMKTILRHVLATRAVLPASRKIERPHWRSAILVPSAGGRVTLHRHGQ